METLIVYYSRTGTTREIADRLSVHLNADLLELEDSRDRSGIFGLIRSGFDALTSNVTVIDDFDHQIDEYDAIIIGTPVWAGKMTPAVRTFLLGNAGVLPEVAFFVTLAGSSPRGTLEGMEELADKEPLANLILNKDEALGQKGDRDKEIEEFVRMICDKIEEKPGDTCEANKKSPI
ncbi:flavodoxin family protein [Halarsenatibacter silvermanii]|uniref:Flavodoxin-like domain-containing protein n=1 Tax=Halarsenatibacter silvermanii TaxID=321763 RepID=A0A1G9H5A5_9FIRM|nr:hypothetical protein [Halarsenatibacter silvermanii]SDL07623.1 hypothetical protein SAMN04488692_10193 [Halarsenatibacter silvermanii]